MSTNPPPKKEIWGITAIFSALAALPVGAATVAGTIVDDSGRTLANARVTIQTIPTSLLPARIGGPVGESTPFYRELATSPNGSFSLDNVPPGLVQVCASLPAAGYIDPCIWKPQANAVILRDADRKVLTGLRAERGHSLSVTVSDPGGVWAERTAASAATASSSVRVGVESPVIGFLPMRLTSTAGTNRYEVLVPADLPLIVSARSNLYTFDAEDGSIPQRKQAGILAFKVDTPRGAAGNSSPRAIRRASRSHAFSEQSSRADRQ